MSVTFWLRGATTVSTKEICVCGGSGVEYGEVCPYCNGAGFYEVEQMNCPTVNISNLHARSLMELSAISINPEEGLCGEVAIGDLPRVHHAIMKSLNLEHDRKGFCTESEQHGNFHYFGLEDDRLRRKLSELLEVVRSATQQGVSIIFG